MKTLTKKLIALAGAAVVGGCIGAVLGYGPLLNYKSEGILSVEMGISEYKRYAELANDPDAITRYVAATPIPNLREDQRKKLVAVVTKGGWQKPLPKVSKADSKELPEFLIQLEQERMKNRELNAQLQLQLQPQLAYIGLRLAYADRDPEVAAGVSKWLGGYFKDVAAREAIRSQISQWTLESRQFSDRSLERKLKLAFDVEQAQTRAVSLQSLLASYPDSARRDPQQVVDVRKDNEKFMSPLSQLLAAESEVISIREQIKKLDRDIEQQTFTKSLIEEAGVMIEKVQRGSDSVINLSALIVDATKKVKTDAEREKLLSLAADVSQITARFLTQVQFIAPPPVPSRPENPTPLIVVLLSGLLTMMATALFIWRTLIFKDGLDNLKRGVLSA